VRWYCRSASRTNRLVSKMFSKSCSVNGSVAFFLVNSNTVPPVAVVADASLGIFPFVGRGVVDSELSNTLLSDRTCVAETFLLILEEEDDEEVEEAVD
jgi:hypothetical protein